jgi:hypothetical protein
MHIGEALMMRSTLLIMATEIPRTSIMNLSYYYNKGTTYIFTYDFFRKLSLHCASSSFTISKLFFRYHIKGHDVIIFT